MTREEEEEVRLLLSRHQERIMLDLGSTDLLAVLVKNAVLSQSEEDLLLKPYAAAVSATAAATSAAAAAEPDSAPSSVGALTKRKLSAVASSSSGSGSGGSASVSGVGVGGDYSSSLAGSSRSASVNGDHAQSDNRSLTPSVGGNLNDAEILRLQCANLIDIIAKSGFEKFKQFCYAIECECPQLIEDLINDRLKSGK
ncbi:hypothetical protein KR093_004607 [Drosophila rubida]|uniref:Uncharacterized protein n=1 Tax=Drosophila rubida TaxID=30044 RepID=A0AAD4PHM8_9MUSC|nr:hypothetical protein KR093_004607 [Drosophila rubida]